MNYRSPVFGEVRWPWWHDVLIVAAVLTVVRLFS